MDVEYIYDGLMKKEYADIETTLLVKEAVGHLKELELANMLLQGEETDRLTGSEVLYGFAGWLTTRKGEVTIGSTHPVGTLVDLIKLFIETNNLKDPRVGWENNLIHPIEKK